jgi:hypothetical protein
VFGIVYLGGEEVQGKIVILQVVPNARKCAPGDGHREHRGSDEPFGTLVVKVAGIGIAHGSRIIGRLAPGNLGVLLLERRTHKARTDLHLSPPI